MTIIITGGTGQIGRTLAADWVARGHEIIVLSRDPKRGRGALPSGVRVEAWDARSAAGWGRLAEGAEAIVNLAGEPLPGRNFIPSRWTPNRKQEILESRQRAGQAVVEAVAAAAVKPRLVVQASAVGYYGPNPAGDQTEDSPSGGDFLARVCLAWEAATAPVEALGVRRIILRTGLLLDPGEGVLPRLTLPFKLFVGGPLGNGKQWMPWIHRRDHARAAGFLLESEEARGPFNLCAPNPVTNNEFARTLGRVMRRPAFLRVPAFALNLALGEISTTVLDGQKAVPNKLRQAGFEFEFSRLEPALRDVLSNGRV